MLRRKRASVPANEGVTVVPTFAPDALGFHQFAGALEQTTAGLSHGIRPVIDARGTGRWHGWSNGAQALQPAGARGTGRAVVNPTTRLDQTSGSAVSTPVQAIFQDRMAARRYS